MHPNITKKWNAWNARGINKISSSAVGMEITYSLLKGGRCLKEIRNHNIERLGQYSIQHGYYEYTIRFGDSLVTIRTGTRGKTIVFEFTPRKNADDVLIQAEVTGAFSEKPKIRKKDDALIAAVDQHGDYTLFFLGGDGAIDSSLLLLPLKNVQYLVFTDAKNRNLFTDAIILKKFIDRAKENFLTRTGGVNSNAGTVRVASAAVNLATIFIPELEHVATTSSREWSTGPIWGGYALFAWDCMLTALISAQESKAIAYENIFTILEQIQNNGMIPGGIGKYYTSYDRAITPIESYCVLRLYRQFGEKSFLKRCYPYLKKSLNYYITSCDGNNDGLYEWRSFMPALSPGKQRRLDKINRLLILGEGSNTIQGAKYASGLDNHPSFDNVEYDENSHTMKLADIGLNALLVNAAECVYTIAELLGNKRDAGFYLRFYEELKQRIQNNLWDEDAGIYKSKTWDGRAIEALGPMNFYPLLAGIPTRKQARYMVQKYLQNPQKFWGKYILPTVARDHPAFQDQNYWRGRIWGPTNYLVFEGLRRYRFAKVFREFANKSCSLFMKEFEKSSHIYENYNAITGEGDDVNRIKGTIKSDSYYPWGALLLLMKIEMNQPWNVFPRT